MHPASISNAGFLYMRFLFKSSGFLFAFTLVALRTSTSLTKAAQCDNEFILR